MMVTQHDMLLVFKNDIWKK